MSIFVPLAMQPFADFGQGCKTVEVRSAKSPVAAQVRKAKPGDEVRLRWGYGPHGIHGIRQWTGTLGRVWYADSLGALDLEAQRLACIGTNPSRYFDPVAPVVAFEVLGVAGAIEGGKE